MRLEGLLLFKDNTQKVIIYETPIKEDDELSLFISLEGEYPIDYVTIDDILAIFTETNLLTDSHKYVGRILIVFTFNPMLCTFYVTDKDLTHKDYFNYVEDFDTIYSMFKIF